MSIPANSIVRSFLFRLVTAAALVFFFAIVARAGGPKYVAGSTFFNPSTMDQPLTWPAGQVNYYTDQGDLSPILPNASANAFVASAFAQWSAVSTASLTITNAGQLAEDVNGSNIVAGSYGTITAPADITSAATGTPVGIVYDFDGSVTNALLGAGAGDASQCFWNAVYGGTDNYSSGANFSHALVVINGQCVLQSSQLTDVEYRLVRVMGSVLGLGWSQMNLNVITRNPAPTSADYAGFPVMHYLDEQNCVPITICYANPYQLAPDDIAALSRLYPAGASATMARIHGSVYFVDRLGNKGQPMQGVNVVARWIDPSTNLPSRQYGASSVSGNLFTGNAGNPITGWNDALGDAYSEFGSSDQTLEGFFDLGGLPIPNGASSAQYQLSVEALDPLWSAGVCPYESSQVAPSGTFTPLIVTVTAGGDVEQDIVMSGSAQAVPAWAATETWSAPAPVPSPGDWVGSLSGYGDVGYFLINAQANRTLSIAVTALDDGDIPSESAAQPVVGIWTLGDPVGTPPPALTTAPFNSATFGMSRLDAQVLGTNSFIIGIADVRGDGRPDYHYHAHVLYGDSASPARVPVKGGAITLQGTGFAPGLTIGVGAASAPVLSTNAGQMLVTVPAQGDGLQTITITDPVSGAFSTMTGVITFGAASSDKLVLLQGGNPPVAVGTQAENPVTVRVVAADGVTAVDGATVGWATTNGATLSVCGGISSCTSVSDENGIASTGVTPANTGNSSITATLAPGVYSPAQSVVASVTATSTSTDIAVNPQLLWVAQGATVAVPITAQVVNLGKGKGAVTVGFAIVQGAGTLSAPSAVTNSQGYASITLTLTNFSAGVQMTACVEPGNNPCQTISANAVASSLIQLNAVSGANQIVAGSIFQPLTVRVTDSSSPPNPILGASVVFQSTVMRPAGNGSGITGDGGGTSAGMPVILSSSQSSVQSNINGTASIVPSVGAFTGTLDVQVQISAGATAFLQDTLESVPGGSGGGASPISGLRDGSGPAARADARRIGDER
jgi:hypothetical protein